MESMLSRIPMPTMLKRSDDPPKLTSGREIPFVGMDAVTTATEGPISDKYIIPGRWESNRGQVSPVLSARYGFMCIPVLIFVRPGHGRPGRPPSTVVSPAAT